MVCFDKKKLVVIIALIMVVVMGFVGQVFADTEDIEPLTLDGVVISSVNFTLTENSDFVTYAIPLEKNYTYHINFTGNLRNFRYSFGNSVDIGTKTENFVNVGVSDDFNIDIVANNYDYLFIYFSGQDTASTQFTYNITREATSGMVYSVDSLVSNVGIDSIWGIFEIAIDYIWVVVLVVFGIFIITRLIKKLSRGKEGM